MSFIRSLETICSNQAEIQEQELIVKSSNKVADDLFEGPEFPSAFYLSMVAPKGAVLLPYMHTFMGCITQW